MGDRSFTVASIFGDHMVLQRQKPLRIWGEAARPQRLRVLLDGREASAAQAGPGAWSLTLPPLEARRDLVLQVAGDDSAEALSFEDVAVGEVWIAGGQSNMEFPLEYDAEASRVIPAARVPDLRFYDCPKVKFAGQEAEDDMSRYGFWRPCEPEHAPFFSAVGYYFAAQLHARYGVPVGVVGCTWTGTSAAAWLDARSLAADENLSVYLREYEAALRELDLEAYRAAEKQGRDAMQQPAPARFMRYIMKTTPGPLIYPFAEAIIKSATRTPLPMGPRSENRPSGLYTTMVQKIAGYAARGVIWYQGEGDDARAELYARLFAALIRCWREAWGDALPFLFVQLAPFERWFGFRAVAYPLLREQQAQVARTVPGAFMASIMDAGSRRDIHPKHKRPVGERLALLARGKVYGEDLLCEAPEASGARLEEGRLIIPFAHTGTGLALKGKALKGLELLADGVHVRAFRAAVQSDAVIIASPALAAAAELELRLAYRNYAEVNLYNSAGLPAKPFRLRVEKVRGSLP